MKDIYSIVTIASVIVLSFLVLIQTRGAELGAGIGGAADVNTKRRGSDKTIFQLTIITSLVFVLSLVFGIISRA
jgi:preprotein translocase subunit SecG